MSSKFVEPPSFVSGIEGTLAEYGVQADVTEIGIAVVIGLVVLNAARTFLSAS